MNDDSKFECCICMNSEKDLILLKCFQKHVVCIDCIRSIKKCPLCRSDITPAVYEKEKEIQIQIQKEIVEVIKYEPNSELQFNNISKSIKRRRYNNNSRLINF